MSNRSRAQVRQSLSATRRLDVGVTVDFSQIAHSPFEIGLKFYPDVGQFLADPIKLPKITEVERKPYEPHELVAFEKAVDEFPN